MTIPDLDETTLKAYCLGLACIFERKDHQRAMAIADTFYESIDPLQCEDGEEITFTLEKKP